jgi:amidase
MQRRDFLKTGSIAGLTTLVAASCTAATTDKKTDSSETPLTDDFELNEVTIDTLQQKMKNKELTSR